MAINLHPAQSKIYKDFFVDQIARHFVVVASRGWGKSHEAAAIGVTGCFELMELPRYVPNKNVYIIAPTFDQVVDIYYPIIAHQFGILGHCIKSSANDGEFVFPNNVNLRLVSYEAVERLRGKGAYIVINDEVSSWTKGNGHKAAWEGIIEPMISTRWSPERAAYFNAPSAGRSLTISTPKGYNYLYDQYYFMESDPDWQSYHFTYRESPLLDINEIERIKRRMDPIEFAREYLASFKDSGNNVFYTFDRRVHVRGDVPDFVPPQDGLRGEDVHAAIDFNINIMATSLWAIRGNQAHGIREFKGYPNTETLAKALRGNFIEKGHTVYAYPDPTGKAEKSSSPIGVTDLAILEAHGIIVRARNGSPPIADSVQAVNRKFLNAAGEVSAFLHPRMKGTIESLEKTVWLDRNPDAAQIDKREGKEHFSDGIRYFFEYTWPVLRRQGGAKRGFKF